MERREPWRQSSRLRTLFTWLLSGAILAVYLALPDGDDSRAVVPAAEVAEAQSDLRIDIVEVLPSDVSPGRAVTVNFLGAKDDAQVQVFIGKTELEVLARRQGSAVVRLPSGLAPGRVKLRVADGEERSKPYDLRVKAENWQKPFRNLVGGFALLLLGIGILARGARAAVGLGAAQALARMAVRGPAALGLGATLGVVVQSTTAAAGMLSGLVTSSLLAVAPAATAFLGAQIGAATAPLVTGLFDPREGLVVVALGVFWLGMAQDRRGSAIGRLLLGSGLIAFGLQTLRPGFEPFVQHPQLLELMAHLNVVSLSGLLLCAALGALLVALLQGPAPVVVLVLALAQATAHWDLRTALAVLSGSSFGAALGALLTTPRGRAGRELATLNLALGLLGSFLAVLTVPVWSYLADRLIPGIPHEISWGKRVLLPHLGLHLGIAFALSQLATALVLLPCVRPLGGWLNRHFFRPDRSVISRIGDPAGVARAQLVEVLLAQVQALPPLKELSIHGERSSGRLAEHRLAATHAGLADLIAGPLCALPESAEARQVARLVFTALQVQRALAAVHAQAERLLDSRIAASAGGIEIFPLSAQESATLLEMQSLLAEGLAAAAQALATRSALDVDASRAREIHLNALEARSRGALLVGNAGQGGIGARLSVLELVDAFETAGNQLYRLSEALSDSLSEASVARVV